MGAHSSLGPIDPQIRGIPAHGVVEEFNRAVCEIKADAAKIPVWQPIIAKYNPTLIGECEKALKWSDEIVREWLLSGMLRRRKDKNERTNRILKELGDHALTKSHARHLSLARCKEIGLVVTPLEQDHKLQDAVLSVHHACIHTFAGTDALKIVENQKGIAQVTKAVMMQVKKG